MRQDFGYGAALQSAIRIASAAVKGCARWVCALPGEGQVAADGLTTQQLCQVFLNLLLNAAQAIPRGHSKDHTIDVEIDLSATGVEIVARPPGKKRQPLAMLSGGERALTAVALLMAMLELGQSRLYSMNHVLLALSVPDIVSGVGKTVFFAFFIGIIACYNGLHASGGADGVGKATTNTVVVSSISVIVSDFFLTKLFIMVL